MIKAIVAVDEDWGIGKNNDLLAVIPQDRKLFKLLTKGTTVIMGVNTFCSMDYTPLLNRKNIVICRDTGAIPLRSRKTKITSFVKPNHAESFDGGDIQFLPLEKVIEYLRENSHKEIYIIGGGKTYQRLLDFCDVVYVTKLCATFDADVFFPNLDEEYSGFKCIAEVEEKVESEKVKKVKFCKYERVE